MKWLSDCCWTHNRPAWLNGWVFAYELSGCGFESSCSYLNSGGISNFNGVNASFIMFQIKVFLYHAYDRHYIHITRDEKSLI